MNVPAMIKLPSRLSTASLCSAKIEACEPVRMMGFPRWQHMKERAELVYARLSVPCSTTNPSKRW
jgi:hypothetical protein